MTPEEIFAAARRRFKRCKSIRIKTDHVWSSSEPVGGRMVRAYIILNDYTPLEIIAESLTELHSKIKNYVDATIV